MSDIDEVKSRLNIVDVVSERVQLKKTGRNFKALCPFHSEKTPSFIVSPERQTFHCFGCGKGGSVIDFVMEFNHVDFPEALESLAEKAGVKLTRRPPDTAEGKLKQKLYEVNHLASEFYHYLLTKHTLGEKARLYLKNRGISEKSMKTFSLGYSPNNWHALSIFLKKKGYDESILDRAGLTSRGHDMFRGRVMFALKDHRGQVVGFAGRVLDPTVKEAKYINTSETPVYIKSNVLYGLDVTKDAIGKENEAVVMEGELDVISSFQAGIPNVVAIKGSALTEGHVRLLRRFTERLAFALDRDVAGDAAARRGIEIADRMGMDMRVVLLSSGKDPDEAAREHPGLLKKAIKDAIPVYDYFLRSSAERFSAMTVFGKKKIGEELLPILAKIENPIVQAHYAKKLAAILDVSESSITEGLEKTKQSLGKGVSTPAQSSPGTPVRSRPEKLEVYLLSLIIQGKTKEFYEHFVQEVAVSDIFQMPVCQILERLGGFLKNRKTFQLADFASQLPPEVLPTLDEAAMWDIADILNDEKRLLREWDNASAEMQKVVLKRKINEKTKAGDIEGLKELTRKLSSLEKRS